MDEYEILIENDNSILDEISDHVEEVVIEQEEVEPDPVNENVNLIETFDGAKLYCYERDGETNFILISEDEGKEEDTAVEEECSALEKNPWLGQVVQLEDGSIGVLTFDPQIDGDDQVIKLEDGSLGYVIPKVKTVIPNEKPKSPESDQFIIVEVNPNGTEHHTNILEESITSDDDLILEDSLEPFSELIDHSTDVVPISSSLLPNTPIVRTNLSNSQNNVCLECNKSFSSNHLLKTHERKHTGIRPYVCPFKDCQKAFATQYSRKAHIRTHTGEKPYRCLFQDCTKSFKTSGDLQKHIRTHTGERPFPCPIQGCDRSFTTSNIRKVHLRTHTGEKPYVCSKEGCDKSFASATNYRNHVRIHSGEKPYICQYPECLKRFTEYSSLYKHTLVHSVDRPFTCEHCPRAYRQLCTLNVHKRTFHKSLTKFRTNHFVASMNEKYIQVEMHKM